MSELAANRPFYLAFWREVLVGWLGWTEPRFAAWARCWELELQGEGNPFFYHEQEDHTVLRLLVAQDLAAQLAGRHTRGPRDDLDYLLDDLHKVFLDCLEGPGMWIDAVNWRIARELVGEVLQARGSALPRAEEVTDYERRILTNPIRSDSLAENLLP